MKNIFLLLLVMSQSFKMMAQNIIPKISNTTTEIFHSQNRIDIRFDVTDPDNTNLRIECKVYDASVDKKYTEIIPDMIQGDVGFDVKQGPNKQISLFFDLSQQSKSLFICLSVYDNEPVAINEILNKVSPDSLMSNLLKLQGIRHSVNPGHYNASRQFIASKSEQFLNSKSLLFVNAQYNCLNYESTKHGSSKPSNIIIMDAHYDSAANSPGADDNGSGVVGVLEAMRILSEYSFKKSIRFLFFDLEEAGLVGSNVYASTQLNKRDSLKAVINFEMIGYYSDLPNTQDFPAGFNVLFPDAYNEVLANNRRGDFIINVGNTNSLNLKNSFHNNTKTLVPDLKIISLEVPGNGSIAPDLRRSDHATFWDRNIPALMITDGANFRNKNYHTPRDSTPYLNFQFMANVVKASMATMIELAEIEHGSSLEIPIDLSTSYNEETKDYFTAFYSNQKFIINQNFPSSKSILKIYNLFGQLIYSEILNPESDTTYTVLCPEYLTGVYFIQINSTEGTHTQKIFVYGK